MHEQLYRTKEGTYFIHFEGGAESRYGIRVGCFKDKGRSVNYSMNEEESQFSEDYLISAGEIGEDELPF